MLHNILQIKMTKLSGVIKILAINSISVGGFYIILEHLTKILISPTPNRIGSQRWKMKGKMTCFWMDSSQTTSLYTGQLSTCLSSFLYIC